MEYLLQRVLQLFFFFKLESFNELLVISGKTCVHGRCHGGWMWVRPTERHNTGRGGVGRYSAPMSADRMRQPSPRQHAGRPLDTGPDLPRPCTSPRNAFPRNNAKKVQWTCSTNKCTKHLKKCYWWAFLSHWLHDYILCVKLIFDYNMTMEPAFRSQWHSQACGKCPQYCTSLNLFSQTTSDHIVTISYWNHAGLHCNCRKVIR